MNARLALITFVDGPAQTDPGYGVEAPGGRPDNTLPGQPPVAVQLPVYPFDPTDPGFGVGRPDQPDNTLPGGRPERPDNSLPGGRPGRPDNSLPSGGAKPDNSLPGGGQHPSFQPIVPGARFVVKWLACKGLVLVPDNTLPSQPGRPG